MDTQDIQASSPDTSQDKTDSSTDAGSQPPQPPPNSPKLQPGMTPTQIRFANKHGATVIVPPPDTPTADVVSALGLEQPDGVLLMVGGSMLSDEEVAAKLIQLFSRGLARAAADAKVAIIDGGRNSGVMAITGRGVADRGYKSPLIGVAPAKKITHPDSSAGSESLDPNHTHFILTEGNEWGDETDTMFDLASTLAGDKQVVTVLVNGDELAKKQVLLSVRRNWPVIIIRGSGGLADNLAELWNKRPAFIPDPDLAEIAIEGRLHFFRLGIEAISEFERRLEHLLHYHEADTTNTLDLAWQRFAEYDQNANRQQRAFAWTQGSVLILGVIATLLAIISFLYEDSEGVNFFIERGLYFVLLAVPIVISLLTALGNRFSAGNKWILLRASAETIKKEIYRYRTRTEIYSDRATKKISREMKLDQKTEALSRKLMQTEVNVSAIKPYQGPIPPKNVAPGDDDGKSFLSAERYVILRLQDQLNYYRSKTVKLENKLTRLQWLILGGGAVGTFLVAIEMEIWIALTTSIVTALTTYLEYQQVENTLMRYNQTATDLENVRSWWIALSDEEQADPRNIDKLVAQTETTIHSEHAAWVQEMQDAMAELRAEQTDKENEDEDGDGTTKIEAGDLLITNVNR